ncbi:MAG: DUF1033 family protein [Streptococcaceae bacterium]|jgi:hypothetical protein|nr:DUF1033 family protein [Streptococcaceae bacterium]
MYQVVEMTGFNEPWWFADGWRDDIVSLDSFAELSQALTIYEIRFQEALVKFDNHATHAKVLSAFWNPGEIAWCEPCEDNLQIYHGLLLLRDYEKVTTNFELK